jgi:hypothetical protein
MAAKALTMKSNRIGKRGPLPHPSGISEEGPNLTVDIDFSLSSLDELHQPVNHHSRKTLAEKNLLEELPVHPVIGLLEVELQNQTLEFLDSELMSDVVESENPFMQTSSPDECRLTVINSPMS